MVVSFFLSTYYNIINAWAFWYLFHSFQVSEPVPERARGAGQGEERARPRPEAGGGVGWGGTGVRMGGRWPQGLGEAEHPTRAEGSRARHPRDPAIVCVCARVCARFWGAGFWLASRSERCDPPPKV